MTCRVKICTSVFSFYVLIIFFFHFRPLSYMRTSTINRKNMFFFPQVRNQNGHSLHSSCNSHQEHGQINPLLCCPTHSRGAHVSQLITLSAVTLIPKMVFQVLCYVCLCLCVRACVKDYVASPSNG